MEVQPKHIQAVEAEIKDLESDISIKRTQLKMLKDKYIKENALVPEQTIAKATWTRRGRKYSGVVFVTVNHIYETEQGGYKVLPNLIKLDPIPEKNDDGNGPHYYTEHWAKRRNFITYDDLLSIEPYDAPRQTCGRCLWLSGRKEGDKLYSGCSINLGYKCDGGKAFACDRFQWWNQENVVGMTHYDWMMNQAAESKEEKKNFK